MIFPLLRFINAMYSFFDDEHQLKVQNIQINIITIDRENQFKHYSFFHINTFYKLIIIFNYLNINNYIFNNYITLVL